MLHISICGLVLLFANVQSLNTNGENVCLQTENYEDTVMVKTLKPKTEIQVKRCWDVSKFFKCNHRVTKWVYEDEPRIIMRNRVVAKCCDGFEEHGAKCVPKCSKGCANGYCRSPDVCVCDFGYAGATCDKKCGEGSWGMDCGNKCECFVDGKCEMSTGECECEMGWKSDRCKMRCDTNFNPCKLICDCSDPCTDKCAPINSTTDNPVSPTTEDNTNEYVTQSTTTEQTTETSTIEYETTEIEEIIKKVTIKPLEANIEAESEIIETTTTSQSYNDASTTTEPDASTAVESTTEIIETSTAVTESSLVSNTKAISTIFYFLPTLSIFSGASFFIIIITAYLLHVKNRKRFKGFATEVAKDDKRVQMEVYKVSIQTENFFWINNTKEKAVSVTDVDLNTTTPVLETFKPLSTTETKT